jgi:hypothetical protein
MKNFCERLSQMIDYYANGKNIIFAKKIEIGESNVRSWLSGTLPKLDAIEKIAINCENISLKWLLTGEGTMLKTDTPDDGAKTEEETASDGVTAALERIIQRQAKEIARLEIELEKYRQDGGGQ